MDRRSTPANGRVAASSLRGTVDADYFTDGSPAVVLHSVTDLLATPKGARDRQLVFGAQVTEFERRDGWSFVQAHADGYVGYVKSAALSHDIGPDPTHVVTNAATHVYSAPDLKSPERLWLSMGVKLHVHEIADAFARTPAGFVPRQHLEPLDAPLPDLAETALRLLGCPYLWGGNTSAGIDCSGLVQLACHMAHLACPGDSDQQRRALGTALADDAPIARNDLFFWPGHVALAVNEADIIHANAHHMAVTTETFETVRARIDAAGEGPLLARKRLVPSSL